MLKRIAIVFLLCSSLTAHASIFDVYGFNARGIGLGGAVTALANDYTATYYNPAGISDKKMLLFGGGFMLSVPWLDVNRTRPICSDLPQTCRSLYPNGFSDRETVLPDSFSGFSLGWVFPFGGPLENKLAMALAVYIPTINVIRVEALDPQTPQFYMYQNLPDELVILGSLAYEPVRWMSLGLGFQVLANVRGSAGFAVDIMNNTFTKQDFRVEISPQAAAIVGLMFKPMDSLRIGLSYRQALGLEFSLPAKLEASSAILLQLAVAGSVLYQPHQFNLGVAYTFTRPAITLSADLGYAMWSGAPDPSPDVTVDLGGSLLESFGLESALDIGTDESAKNLEFQDTWTPRIGVEWNLLDWVQLRAGYYYRPTPAPRASGAVNYLDNSSHTLSVGAAIEFDDPFGSQHQKITLGVGHATAWLPNRNAPKSQDGDPVGTLNHGGITTMFAVSINYTY